MCMYHDNAATATSPELAAARKRNLTEENVRDVLANVIGYDPDEATWPCIPGILAPTREIVEEVVEELGWSPRNRDARQIVSSYLQLLMMAAKSKRRA